MTHKLSISTESPNSNYTTDQDSSLAKPSSSRLGIQKSSSQYFNDDTTSRNSSDTSDYEDQDDERKDDHTSTSIRSNISASLKKRESIQAIQDFLRFERKDKGIHHNNVSQTSLRGKTISAPTQPSPNLVTMAAAYGTDIQDFSRSASPSVLPLNRKLKTKSTMEDITDAARSFAMPTPSPFASSTAEDTKDGYFSMKDVEVAKICNQCQLSPISQSSPSSFQLFKITRLTRSLMKGSFRIISLA